MEVGFHQTIDAHIAEEIEVEPFSSNEDDYGHASSTRQLRASNGVLPHICHKKNMGSLS